jgi:hypothetical protein
VYLGQEEKAKAELDDPNIESREQYNIWVKNRASYKNPKDRDRLLHGLSKVGVD